MLNTLFLDIETSPDLIWAWGVYQVDAVAMERPWQLLSYSAKWRGGEHVTKALCDYPKGRDDFYLARDCWNLMDKADLVVAHNGLDFDVKKLAARFIFHGMTPPAPYKVVDTRRELKRIAAFSSNKLDWICKQLSLGHKLEHEGIQLWLDCMKGKREAWAKMKAYNHHDVELLEELYEALAPWMRQPNANLHAEGIVCPSPACGSKRIIYRGYYNSKTRKYARFVCKDCGKWGRSVTSEKGESASVVEI